uniref:Uncharacterized protein n=1 Tax=Rhizophora mucronata TaxID=61149 RepID=A0A2P2QX67_RHIMU
MTEHGIPKGSDKSLGLSKVTVMREFEDKSRGKVKSNASYTQI